MKQQDLNKWVLGPSEQLRMLYCGLRRGGFRLFSSQLALVRHAIVHIRHSIPPYMLTQQHVRHQ